MRALLILCCLVLTAPMAVATLTVDVTPLNDHVPSTGGTLEMDVTITNPGADPVTFPVWTVVTGAGGFRTVINIYRGITLAPGEMISEIITVQVPGALPDGTYMFWFKAAENVPPWVVYSDGFPFYKP